MTMDRALKFAAPVPRYTSYPTALSFSSQVGPDAYARWLQGLPVGDYERAVMAGELASVRGYEMTDGDRVRAFAIEWLMCGMAFSAEELRGRFGSAADPLFAEAGHLVAADDDGLLERHGEGFRGTEKGRPFLRAISAAFDAHLGLTQAAFSGGV